MAVAALCQLVARAETVPVLALVRGQDARALAERADVIQRRQDCPPDEFAAVGQVWGWG